MLNAKVYNLKQLEKTRQDQLNWFTSLAQQSTTWNDEVASAQKELAAVSAQRAAAEAYLAAAQAKLAVYM